MRKPNPATLLFLATLVALSACGDDTTGGPADRGAGADFRPPPASAGGSEGPNVPGSVSGDAAGASSAASSIPPGASGAPPAPSAGSTPPGQGPASASTGTGTASQAPPLQSEGVADTTPSAALECFAGQTRPCYGGPAADLPVPACNEGVEACGEDDRWGACVGWTRPLDNPCETAPSSSPGTLRPPGCDERTYSRLLMPAVNETSGLWTPYLQTFFASEGITVTRGTVNFSRLEAADIVVSDANSLFVDDDLERARRWVSEGGFLILHGGVLSGSDCRRLHDLLAPTGIRFQPVFSDGEVVDCVSPRDSGPIAAFGTPRHPILRDLPDRNFPHESGNRLQVSSPATTVVTSTGGNALVAAQDLGCGRLLVISSYAIVAPTNSALDAHWRNILDWGTWQ